MSLRFFVLTCDRCQAEFSYCPGQPRYVYADSVGETITASVADCWCEHCEKPTKMQRPMSKASLSKDLESLRERLNHLPKSGLLGLFGRRPSVDEMHERDEIKFQIERNMELLRFLGPRVVDGRCLSCGSSNVTPLSESKNLVHPFCGGRLLVEEGGRLSFSPSPAITIPLGDELESPRSANAQQTIGLRRRAQDRNEYNRLVDQILNRDYGVATRDNDLFPGVLKYLELIDTSWKNEASEDECAMQIATLYLSGLFRKKLWEDARPLAGKLDTLGPEGVKNGVVRDEIWQKCVALVERTQRDSGSAR